MNIRTRIYTVVASLCVLIANCFIGVSLGSLGFVSIGSALIVLFCRCLPASVAMLIAGVAGAAGEFVFKCGQYAFYAFIIRGLQGYLAAWLQKKKVAVWKTALVVVLITLIGYSLATYKLYGSVSLVVNALPYRVIGEIISFVAVIAITPVSDKILDEYLGHH